MIDLRVKISSETARTRKRLEGLTRLRLEALLDDLGAHMLEANRHRLDNLKTDADGQAWAPWSAKYAAKRGSGEMLESSGDLLDSLTINQGPDGVSVGSNLLYAIVHLLGSTNRNIPARPFLGFSDEDMEELGQIAVEFLEDSAR